MNKFRPQSVDKPTLIKFRRNGIVDNYNWQTRVEWFPVGYRINKITIVKQFIRLHYLACHAPKPITKRYSKVYDTFYKKHFGVNKGASFRYLNNWSCHSWM